MIFNTLFRIYKIILFFLNVHMKTIKCIYYAQLWNLLTAVPVKLRLLGMVQRSRERVRGGVQNAVALPRTPRPLPRFLLLRSSASLWQHLLARPSLFFSMTFSFSIWMFDFFSVYNLKKWRNRRKNGGRWNGGGWQGFGKKMV